MSDTSNVGNPDGSNYTVTHHGRQNLDTGEITTADGQTIESGLDPVIKAELAKMMAPRTATLVGNVADYQVAGAQAANSGDANGSELPEGRTPLVTTDPQPAPAVEPSEVFAPEEAPAVKTEVVPTSELPTQEATHPSEVESTPIPNTPVEEQKSEDPAPTEGTTPDATDSGDAGASA